MNCQTFDDFEALPKSVQAVNFVHITQITTAKYE